MRWIPYGPNGWQLQFAEQAGDEAFRRGRAIALELERDPPRGLVEYVPAFTTMLLEFEPGSANPSELETLIARLRKAMGMKVPAPAVKEIPVCYDGPDLERVARHNDLRIEDVPRRHAAVLYKVYALGFAPGFPYLGDLDPRLRTPRLDSPRVRVPAGSVAIGGEHTGIYPIETPGGWNIIGHTSLKLFDPIIWPRPGAADGMFALRPGDRVRFVPVERRGGQP